jgi:hypothetical protein
MGEDVFRLSKGLHGVQRENEELYCVYWIGMGKEEGTHGVYPGRQEVTMEFIG